MFGVAGVSVAPAQVVQVAGQDGVVAVVVAYGEASSERLVKSAGYKGEVVSWRRYRWFRPKVIGRAEAIGVEAVDVERALFQIDLATGTNIKTP
jgi:hypothetical protein